MPPVYTLHTDDVTRWDQNVTNIAINILDDFLSNIPTQYNRLPFIDIVSSPNSTDKTFECEICCRIFVGQFQWNEHIKSNKHKRMVQRNRRNITDNEDKKLKTN